MTPAGVEHVKAVIKAAEDSVGAGNAPTVAIIVDSDGDSHPVLPGAREVEGFNDGSTSEVVLYSYGRPEDSLLASLAPLKVVYLIDDELLLERGLISEQRNGIAVETVRFPLHPALNAFAPLRAWDEAQRSKIQ